MIEIEFNNISKGPIRKKILAEITKKTIEKSQIFKDKGEKVALAFADITEAKMKKLNFSMRGKKQSTDVLSFPEYESMQKIKRIVDKEVFLGEVVLCYNDIEKYCKKKGLSLKREFRKVVAHGVLHLLGFRHGKKMFALQEKVADET